MVRDFWKIQKNQIAKATCFTDDLKICTSSEDPSSLATLAISKPREASFLLRLARLALEIFGCTDSTSPFRPDDDYAMVVQKATFLVLSQASDTETVDPPHGNESSIQALFDLTEDPTWDWGMLLDDQTDRHMQL